MVEHNLYCYSLIDKGTGMKQAGMVLVASFKGGRTQPVLPLISSSVPIMNSLEKAGLPDNSVLSPSTGALSGS